MSLILEMFMFQNLPEVGISESCQVALTSLKIHSIVRLNFLFVSHIVDIGLHKIFISKYFD